MNQDEFNLYMLGKLGEVERDLFRMSTNMTRIVATATECREKVGTLRRELNDRILAVSHERPAVPKVVPFTKEQ